MPDGNLLFQSGKEPFELIAGEITQSLNLMATDDVSNSLAGDHIRISSKVSTLCMRKLADSSNPAADNLFGHFEVIGRLQVDPVLRRLAKGLAEK